MLELMSVSATPSREWEDEGRCRVLRLHPDVFDDVGPMVRIAKRNCALCPVQQKCLEANIDEPWGIWGGLNHIERKAHAAGAPIRLCGGCNRTFARARGDRCTRCQRTPITPSVLREHADSVRAMADQGLTDPQIAVKLSELIRVHVKASHVRATRRRHHIDAGVVAAARNRPFSEAAIVVAVARGLPGWIELSQIERVEMLRRWLRDGGTVTTFCHKYQLYGWRRRELQALIAQEEAA